MSGGLPEDLKPERSQAAGSAIPVADTADLLVAYLAQLGVEYAWGVPGGAIEPLLNAVARGMAHGGPRPVVARHETGAAFMAHGYHLATGRLGVCFATTGPGATNLITGVASAWENNVPLLVLTAQTPLSTFGKGAFQESSCTGVDTVGMFRHCTRYNTLVSHPAQLEIKLARAVLAAFQRPYGPSHLSLPMDVLRASSPVPGPSFDLAAQVHPPVLVDENSVERLAALLVRARHPVFVVGAGCTQAVGSLLELAVQLQAEVVTTPQGKGLVSPYHPLYRGVFGFAGHADARRALAEDNTDLVIAVGTSFTEWNTSAWDPDLMGARLVHVDECRAHLHQSPMARLHVHGNLVAVFDALLEKVEGSKKMPRETAVHAMAAEHRGPRRRHFRLANEGKWQSDATPIKPQRLMYELGRRLPPATRYFADVGNSMAWAIHYLLPFDRRVAGRRVENVPIFQVSTEWASMGWAIGAAVGAARARSDMPVVCITGDGALLMSGQELTVAVQERLPMLFIVLNDAALGMVKHGQRLNGAEQVGFELPRVNFADAAQAMGARGHVVRSPADLAALDLKALCRGDGPVVLDVHVDPAEIPPMSARLKVLRGGAG